MVAATTVQKERSRRLSTAILNQVIREAVAFKSPPRTRGGKRGRVYYCTQVIKTLSQCFLLAVKEIALEAFRFVCKYIKCLYNAGSNKASDVCFLCKRRKAVFGYVQKVYGEAATH